MHDPIQPEIDAVIRRVFERAEFIGGEECREFERELAASVGVANAVGASSCTSALSMALLALGLHPGDEVIVPAHTYIASAEAAAFLGIGVRFVDVEPRYPVLNAEAVERAIGPRTRAVIAVHLYGFPCDMDPILDVARRRGLFVVEDCAQSQGSLYKGRPTGSMGHASCFSFFPSKNLGAAGDAGALCTNDAEVAKRARMAANHGRREKFLHEVVGYNLRLDPLQAAILRVKLRHLDQWNQARRAAAKLYRELLAGLPEEKITLPDLPDFADPAPHLFVVRLKQRDRVRDELKRRGIDTGIHYPAPLHVQPAFASLGLGPGAMPNSEVWCAEALSLPMHGAITPGDVRATCAALREILA